MKENKFRAWDNVDFKMYYLGEEENIHFYFNSNGIMAERFINIKTVVVDEEIDDVHYEKLEHLKYMQYTGLKDKNGTEIFEGDIVTYKHTKFKADEEDNWLGDTETYNRNYAVEYVNTFHQNGYRLKNKNINFLICRSKLCSGEVEVIGNIYENPELLEGAE